MQMEKYEELENRASLSSELDVIKKHEARARIHQEIERMRQSGEALTLTDEEIRLLESFRRFKLRMRKDGEVFTWQTRRPEGVQVVQETANILHPSEVPLPTR
ncbi:MAG TPA: hypothetical protein VNO24_23485 [Blastocatellia bacterium]|nr:hypothetical protein [Blastocatellia bacterium]